MKKNKRLIIMMASIIMIIAATVAGTLAWLYANSDTVTNTFVPAQVGNFIDETFVNNVKSNVKVYNSIGSKTGEVDKLVDAYIRATYVVTWKDTTNNIVIKANDTDYTVDFGSSNWIKIGEYYYYNSTIKPGECTENLIDSVSVNSGVTAPTSTVYPNSVFELNVEIVSQSIQADGVNNAGEKPVQLAWGVTIDETNGTVTAYQAS